ncbi:hypothetical protein UP09_26445 [Bradyrhizobium sp. LTSP885]|uniref:hypothetical protein n=1 Tax=Bradyrhizobium sp. LTSP885 TaxID=1619232 RepID=UPI0005CA4B53|nr:hypothetical protein [Bradyrhizobium sp. LTSP885]KJC38008.1 hypothetical protein UP09_26445 [Bradyrhizobium sp. LTSP885]
MSDYGDDAGHCSNGLNAQKFRDATPEERTTYRRWIRGTVVVYAVLVLAAGTLALISTARVGPVELSSLSTHGAARSTDDNWAKSHF